MSDSYDANRAALSGLDRYLTTPPEQEESAEAFISAEIARRIRVLVSTAQNSQLSEPRVFTVLAKIDELRSLLTWIEALSGPPDGEYMLSAIEDDAENPQ